MLHHINWYILNDVFNYLGTFILYNCLIPKMTALVLWNISSYSRTVRTTTHLQC